MNLIAVQGLGGLGEVSNATTTCVPTEQWTARMDSYNNALSQLSESKTQRWYFLVGGVALGAAAMLLLRAR